MRLRVVCGLGLIIANFWPTSLFNKVDLPALGRPRMQTNPERKDIWQDYISFICRGCATEMRTRSTRR